MVDTACEMTREVLARVLAEKPKLYYRTASLNNVLYVHRKGFKNLGGLEEFSGLKALYADGNGGKTRQHSHLSSTHRKLGSLQQHTQRAPARTQQQKHQ